MPEPFALEAVVCELREKARVPGVAVGLLAGGDAEFAGDGVTNADHPLPIDETTLFQIASLTKAFTATALLRLVAEGKLDLAAPVRAVLPDFRLPRAEWTERVAIRDLLTHRSGWQGDRFFIRPPRERTLAGLIAEFADNEQLAPPGAVYSYDNAAFAVAGRVVEVASGAPYPDALRRLVLEPLGLDRTFLRADQVVTHRVAAPHIVGASGPHVLRGGGWQPGWQLAESDLPAGGLISCVRDLLRWARFQLGDGRAPDGTQILPPELLLQMQTETHPAGCGDAAVGLAWLLKDHGGERFVGHTGQTIGYLSEILFSRSRGFALVALTNAVSDGGFRRDLVERVLAGVLGLDARPPAPRADLVPPSLAEYERTWRGPFALETVRASGEPGVLRVESTAHAPKPGAWTPPPPPPSRWAFYAPDRLVALEPEAIRGSRAEFVRGADGRIAWFRRGGRIAPPVA